MRRRQPSWIGAGRGGYCGGTAVRLVEENLTAPVTDQYLQLVRANGRISTCDHLGAFLDDRRSAFGSRTTSLVASIHPRFIRATHQALEMAAACSGPLHCWVITTSCVIVMWSSTRSPMVHTTQRADS
jgi:hypothetical protein